MTDEPARRALADALADVGEHDASFHVDDVLEALHDRGHEVVARQRPTTGPSPRPARTPDEAPPFARELVSDHPPHEDPPPP